MVKLNSNRPFYFIKLLLALGLFVFSTWSFSQSQEGGIKFLFECDSMQTTILADQHISITVTEENGTIHLAEDNYCSSKLITLKPGKYTVHITSDKFCDEEVHNVVVCSEKVTFVLLDLYRSSSEKCKNIKQFSPPVSTSCG
jgi:hypothetical protein